MSNSINLTQGDAEYLCYLWDMPVEPASVRMFGFQITALALGVRASFEATCLDFYEKQQGDSGDFEAVNAWFAEHPDQIPPLPRKVIALPSGRQMIVGYEGLTFVPAS